MDKEYIEREAMIQRLKNTPLFSNFNTGGIFLRDGVIDLVEKQFAADVVEVKHGGWGKEKWADTDQHVCSLCHSTVRVHPQSVEYRYCPYCGAKMDGDGKSNG